MPPQSTSVSSKVTLPSEQCEMVGRTVGAVVGIDVGIIVGVSFIIRISVDDNVIDVVDV